ncbi:hypothetical protein [Sporosarcina sp. OR05]|uniref:hypothetical protein n=1 Tax=Sporosarcina sp. OR05 TaxID=2969819 RepID=UPI00352A026E
MKLQFSDVKEISVVHDPGAVNSLIKKGWVLLTIESSSSEGEQYPLYILGWCHDVTQDVYEKQQAVLNV